MPTLDIKGIPVEFPYEPYQCQVIYMEKLMEALIRSGNAALESPTGTGKTLCLLCATIAYSKAMKSKISIDATGNPQGASSGSLYPKILYASRTHSQLAQVVRELNKTSYKDTITVSLGSREFLCINEKVGKESNNATKAVMCRSLVKTRKCRYFNEFDKQSKEALQTIYNANGLVPDIEDMVSIGKKHALCPYYRTRSLYEDADLILLPYNYIVDPRLRRIHKIELRGNIVIFDEAHNLDSVCENAVSVSFSTKELSGCIRETKTVLKMLMDDDEEIRTKMDNTDMAFGALREENNEPKLEKNDVAQLLKILQSTEEAVDNMGVKGGRRLQGSEGMAYPGNKMISIFETSGIKRDERDNISLLIDRMAQYLLNKGEGQSVVLAQNGANLQQFSSLVSVVYSDSDDPYSPLIEKKDRRGRQEANQLLSESLAEKFQLYVLKAGKEITLNYWCFSPLIAMRYISARMVRSMIVTSGTLSPLTSFIENLGIDMRVTLENEHAAGADQIVGACIRADQDGYQLCGNYANRNTKLYLSGVGMAVLHTCAMVPQGVLVFFSSYSVMNFCLRSWKAETGGGPDTIWTRMSRHKKLFVEPHLKVELKLILVQFREAVNEDTGALLFAVCRAKVSEGIDFSDAESRAVLVIGIPYAPPVNPRVELKKMYLNECRRKAKNSSNAMTGDDWYQTDAIRAVNQAIGRVLRHKDDFGAVVLVDCRFNLVNKQRFPSWMRDSLKKYKSIADFETVCRSFFAVRGFQTGRASVLSSSGNTAVPIKKRKAEQFPERGTSIAVPIAPPNLLTEFDSLYNSALPIPPLPEPVETPSIQASSSGMLSDIEEMSEWKKKELEFGIVSKPKAICPKRPITTVFESKQTTTKKIKLKPNSVTRPSTASCSKAGVCCDEKAPNTNAEQLKNYYDMVTKLGTSVRGNFNRSLFEYQKSRDIEKFVNTIVVLLLPDNKELFKASSCILLPEHQSAFIDSCQQFKL